MNEIDLKNCRKRRFAVMMILYFSKSAIVSRLVIPKILLMIGTSLDCELAVA